MNKNPFSVLDTKVSRLGFGCMRFPTTEAGDIDKEKAFAMLDYAYQNGVTYFDTAWGYHEEQSQYVVGEALSRYPRDSFYLATKMPPWKIKEGETAEYLFEEQRKRCQVEYFDYYLMHAMNREYYEIMKEHKVYEYLAAKKEQGIIKNLGFSFHGDLMVLELLLDNYDWDFVQLQVNYFDDAYQMSDANKEYEMVTERGIPVVVMEPVRGGFLANPPAEAVRLMKEYDPAISPAAWAFKWCLHHDNMKLILSGMSTMEQVEENIHTFATAKRLTLPEEDLIAQVADVILSVDTVPCTDCRYCMDCDFGVDIPGMFRTYNDLQIFQREGEIKTRFANLQKDNKDFTQCTRCGVCEPLCPQNIAIPDELERVGEYLTQKFR